MSTTLVLTTSATTVSVISSSSGSFPSKFYPLGRLFFLLCTNLNTFSGAWLVFPSYMIYLTGSEILQGLTIVAGGTRSSPDDTTLVKTE
jgi:hypothetical protein